MNENLKLMTRNLLKARMTSVFKAEIKQLSTELQQILIDDMITTFENRINVLNRSINKGAVNF